MLFYSGVLISVGIRAETLRCKSLTASRWRLLSQCWICLSFTSEEFICHCWVLLHCLYCNDFSVHLSIDCFIEHKFPLVFLLAVTKSIPVLWDKKKKKALLPNRANGTNDHLWTNPLKKNDSNHYHASDVDSVRSSSWKMSFSREHAQTAQACRCIYGPG